LIYIDLINASFVELTVARPRVSGTAIFQYSRSLHPLFTIH
jgi:hypothetical protein